MSRNQHKKQDDAELMEKLMNPFWRLQNLYHIKSEETGAISDFNPYPEQMEVFNAVLLEGHKSIIIPKARRRGMSTGIDLLMLDYATTRPGFEGGIVDRNQAEATKKLTNTVKISVDKLPAFMLDTIVKGKNNDDQLSFGVAGDAESTIYAGTTYRGGNCNMLHVSEWGWIQCEDLKRSEEIQTGAIQAARKGLRIVETTWKGGKHGHLWKYTEEALETPDEHKHARSWRVMFFPWHTDPVYQVFSTNPIRREVMDYFKELSDRFDNGTGFDAKYNGTSFTEAQMRWYQEEAWPLGLNRFGEYPSALDECFLSPMQGVIYEAEMSRAIAERRITTIPVEKFLPVFVSFDLGVNDAMPFVYIQPVGKEERVVGYGVNHRENIGWYANTVKAWMAEKDVPMSNIYILLPHDGGRKSLETGRTLQQAFTHMGFPNVMVVPKIPNTWTGINYVRDTFPYLWFDKSAMDKKHTRGTKKFPTLRECLDNYHQAEQKNGMLVSMEPVHDDYSHGPDALRTFCEARQRGLLPRSIGGSDPFGGDFDAFKTEDQFGSVRKSRGTIHAGGDKWRR